MFDYECRSFLKDIAEHVEPQWQSHAIGALHYYMDHECLSSGYLKTTKLNALKQKKIVPDGLLPLNEKETPPKPGIDREKSVITVDVSLNSDLDILEALIVLLQEIAKQIRNQ